MECEITENDSPEVDKDEKSKKKKPVIDITTVHPLYGKGEKVNEFVGLDLATHGSEGTQKYIFLSGPLQHTVKENAILVIDEFEARLHPLLAREIIEWFHGPENQGTAQLIIATHDVLLMDPSLFRRDQIWFCEKDISGASSAFSLADFDPNQVRPTTKFSRQYLLGIFGAIPKLI